MVRRCSRQFAGNRTQLKPLYKIIRTRKINVPVPVRRGAVIALQIGIVYSHAHSIWYGLHNLAVAGGIKMAHIIPAHHIDAPLFTCSDHEVGIRARAEHWHQGYHSGADIAVVGSEGSYIVGSEEISFGKRPTDGR